MTDISFKNKKIAVLLGGTSSERKISIKSGTAVYEALRSLGLDVVCIDASDDPIGEIRQKKTEVVFIALHGRFGEDGTLQAILEKEKIPYAGSGPSASRLAMDKLASRRIFEDAGLPVPKYFAVNKFLYDKDMPLPGTVPNFARLLKAGRQNWDCTHFFTQQRQWYRQGTLLLELFP